MRDRTAELEAERRKTVESARAKSVLLSRMSHEFRTPLGAMMGFASLIEESEDLPEEHRGYARVIAEAGEKILGLIRSILDLSRAEASVGQCAQVPFELRSLVGDVVQLLSVSAPGSGVLLSVKEEGWPTGPIIGDPERLREVLINLLGNAIKYTPAGGGIEVSCLTDDQSVALSVRDSGPGIRPEDQTKLFNPFVRLGGNKPGEGGAGLGLTIAKQLVEAMGGCITVESTLGEGSTFTVKLPLVRPEVQEPRESGLDTV